jgi:hypothetical protein
LTPVEIVGCEVCEAGSPLLLAGSSHVVIFQGKGCIKCVMRLHWPALNANSAITGPIKTKKMTRID